jgi:hypothetical protein
MSTKIRPAYAFLLLTALALSSCETHPPLENPDPYIGPTVAQEVVLTLTNDSAKTWQPVYRMVNGVIEPLDACEQDDRWTFHKNGDLVKQHFTTPCFVNEPVTETLNWGKETGNFIRVGNLIYPVKHLTPTELMLKYQVYRNNIPVNALLAFVAVK